MEKPIPLQVPSVDGWKDLPIKFSREPLVPLGPFSNYNQVFTNSVYAGEYNDSPYSKDPKNRSLITVFVRKEAANQLVRAQKLLPQRMYLVAYDIYRPLEVQQSLYDSFYQDLSQQQPDWDDPKLSAEAQNFVSLPSYNPDRPSPHNTGGVVDLAIFNVPENAHLEIAELRKEERRLGKKEWERAYEIEMRRSFLFRTQGRQLEFGTPYDYAGEEGFISYYESLYLDKQLSAFEEEARNNRRLLYHLMKSVGFEAFHYEWWHFNSRKSQMGAKAAGLKYAEYGMASLSDENWEHERMRAKHREGSIKLSQSTFDRPKVKVESDVLTVARETAIASGDLRISSLANAAIIKPT